MKFPAVILFCAAPVLLGAAAPQKSAAAKAPVQPAAIVMEAEKADFDASALSVVRSDRLSGGKGLARIAGKTAPAAKPEVTFKFTVKTPGRYLLRGVCVREAAKPEADASRLMPLGLAVDGGSARVCRILPGGDCREQRLAAREFASGEHVVKIRPPRGCVFDKLTVAPAPPLPGAPRPASDGRSEIVPGPHPRLWATAKTLPKIKADLASGENKAYWEKVRAGAAEPFDSRLSESVGDVCGIQLQDACVGKAFVYLMTGDRKIGAEAVRLMRAGLGAVEFSDYPGAAREIGRLLHAASCVYDWCHNLFSPEERAAYRADLLRLARDFREILKSGRGAPGDCALLPVAIALYGDDDSLYRNCAPMFRELVPPRVGEGGGRTAVVPCRSDAEIFAAWLLRRMADREVADPGVKAAGYRLLYMTRPDGRILADGVVGRSLPTVMLCCYSYAADPVLKGEFFRLGGQGVDPVLFLLLNDPALKAEGSRAELPLSRFFPGDRPLMVARTGWNIGETSNDAVIALKGGGDFSESSRTADAGAFQICHRGELAADSGLCVGENAGPDSRRGKTLGAYAGPGAKRPYFSFLWSDITAAYSDKIGACTRAVCFLNLADPDCPGALIVVDRMSARRGVRKQWVLNTPSEPAATPNGVEILSPRDLMRGRLSLHMFLPREVRREIGRVGKTAGFRTVFSPAEERDVDVFAAVMLIGSERGRRPAVTCRRDRDNLLFIIGDRLVVMPAGGKPQDSGFRFTVPAGGKYYCLLAGLESGLWNVCGGKGSQVNIEATVDPEQHVIFMQLDPGEYLATPGASADELRYTPPAPEIPQTADRYRNATYVNGKAVPGCTLLAKKGVLLIPAAPVAEALGGKAAADGRVLTLSFGGRTAEFTEGEAAYRLDSAPVAVREPAAEVVKGVWYVKIPVIAKLADARFLADAATSCAVFQTRPRESGAAEAKGQVKK